MKKCSQLCKVLWDKLLLGYKSLPGSSTSCMKVPEWIICITVFFIDTFFFTFLLPTDHWFWLLLYWCLCKPGQSILTVYSCCSSWLTALVHHADPSVPYAWAPGGLPPMGGDSWHSHSHHLYDVNEYVHWKWPDMWLELWLPKIRGGETMRRDCKSLRTVSTPAFHTTFHLDNIIWPITQLQCNVLTFIWNAQNTLLIPFWDIVWCEC